MASGDSEKKKLPRTPKDVRDVEDRLDVIRGTFRELRELMEKNDVESVDLAWGSSMFYLDKIQELSRKYAFETGEQVTRITAERAKAGPADKKKKT